MRADQSMRGDLLPASGRILLILLAVALPQAVFAEEGRSPGRVNSALESSSLSEADRTLVRAKAADAVRSGLPAEDVEIVVARSADRGVSAVAIGRFLDAAIAAKKKGAPAGPVLDRIEQGLSKGVPADRIAAAAERLGEKLVIARPLVDGLVRSGLQAGRSADRDDAVAGTARALEQSVSEESLRAIGAAVRGSGGHMTLYANAANTAAYCAANGMKPPTVTRLVREAVSTSSSGRDLDAMVRRIHRELERGTTIDEIEARLERKSPHDERAREHETMHEDMKTDHDRGGGMGGGPGMGGRGR